jgi:hypothetical protein
LEIAVLTIPAEPQSLLSTGPHLHVLVGADVEVHNALLQVASLWQVTDLPGKRVFLSDCTVCEFFGILSETKKAVALAEIANSK